jgi:hypothetical protein
MTEHELLLEVEKWARLCFKDLKHYIGLRDAFDDLDKFRKKAKPVDPPAQGA